MILQVMTGIAAVMLGADTTPVATPRPPLPAAVTPSLEDSLRRPRRRAIEVSDWYARRLAVHRALSYATIPIFVGEYIAGERLFKESSAAPTWAKTGHRVGATALAGIFTVNSVTGLWNLWDSRGVPDHRALRTAHALMMLTADGAFTYAGARLSEQAERSQQKRKLHRTISLSASALTL